jgi:hypothetical protein
VAIVYWRQVSWQVGLVPALHGKWLTAAVGWPGGEPERPGADGAVRQWERTEKNVFTV